MLTFGIEARDVTWVWVKSLESKHLTKFLAFYHII